MGNRKQKVSANVVIVKALTQHRRLHTFPSSAQVHNILLRLKTRQKGCAIVVDGSVQKYFYSLAGFSQAFLIDFLCQHNTVCCILVFSDVELEPFFHLVDNEGLLYSSLFIHFQKLLKIPENGFSSMERKQFPRQAAQNKLCGLP